MSTYSYSICGLNLRLDAESEPNPEAINSIFAQPETEDAVHVNLYAVDAIETPGGVACKGHEEYPTWRDGNRISRCGWDLFRPQPHFRTDYRLDNLKEITSYVRQEDWDWATREKYLWTGIALNYLLLHHRGMIFHASYIGYRGQAILFVAPSGTGKSTQAQLWKQHRGAAIHNGDKAGVSLGKVPMAHGVPFSGSSGICENVSLPLKAVVVLSQAKENVVTPMKPSMAISALCPNLFVDRAITEEWRLAMNLLLDLIQTVPVYSLACTPDEGAVEALEQVIFSKNRGGDICERLSDIQ